MGRRALIAILCMSLVGCVQSFPPPVECRDDNNCYIQHTLDTMNIIASQVDYWDNVSLLTAIVAGIAGIVATIMIALQGDANRYWTRPTGIIATSLVTGITALVASFHLPESTDKYILAYTQLGTLNNKFEHDLRTANTPDQQDALRYQYASDFSTIKADLLKVKGSLSLVSKPPSSQSQPENSQTRLSSMISARHAVCGGLQWQRLDRHEERQ